MEKLLKDSGDKIEESDKTDLNAKVSALRSAMSADNAEDIKAKTEELQKAMYAVSEKLYKNAAPQQPQGNPQANPSQPNAGSTTDANGNTVYNAEYHDVDDKDKK